MLGFFFSCVFSFDSGSVLSAENITSVVTATKNEVPAYYPTLFAAMLEKSDGCAQFCKMSAGGKQYCFFSLFSVVSLTIVFIFSLHRNEA